MPAKDGQKRQGRFLKKGDPVLDVIKVLDFNLEEICSTRIILHDNVVSSIIHHSLHDEGSMDWGVRPAKEVKRDLMTPELKRPVLRPLDFTEDWRRQKARQTGRTKRNDDEEELEMELEYQRQQAKLRQSGEPGKVGVKASSAQEEKAPLVNPVAVSGPEETEESERGQEGAAPHFKIQREDIDAMGHLISTMATDDLESRPQEGGGNTEDDHGVLIHADGDEAPSSQRVENEQSEFLPIAAATGEGDNPERQAMETYHQQLAMKRALGEEEKMLVEQARSRGYEDGFQVGEEKGLIQASQEARALLEGFAKTLGELETLKIAILENAQENFHVLCQAMLEALVDKEFELHPDSFAKIVQRAVRETVTGDEFKILVHPDTYERLQGLLGAALDPHLRKSESVEAGDFRIESNLSVVDGNIRELIREMLNQADLSIFEKGAKAS